MKPNNNNNFIKNLSIKGFLSVKEADVELRPINIILGANGAGKTNIFYAINYWQFIQGNLGSLMHMTTGWNTTLHFGENVTKKAEISFKTDEYIYTGNYEFVSDDKQGVCTDKVSYLNSDETVPYKEESMFRNDLKSLNTYMMSDDIHTNENPDVFNDELDCSGQHIASVLYKLKNSEDEYSTYNDIVLAMKAILPYFGDFVFKENDEKRVSLYWKHKDNIDIEFEVFQLSDASKRFLKIITALMQPSNRKVILIDDVDLGLHPATLEVLADIIRCESRDKQIIISTQSPTLANYFKPEDFIVADYENGETKLSRPNREEFEPWLEEYRMGDIWCKNLIGGRP